MTNAAEAPSGLIIEREGSVLRLTLDRPDRRNALTDEIVAELTDAIEGAGSDESVRVISLTGTGDHFCSGFDLSFRPRPDQKPRVGSTQRRMRWQVNRLIPTMLETQTPIVAAARGWAVGLGLSLLLASDFAVVANDARLKFPFTDYGFTPDSGSTWLTPRMAGVARAKEMLMLGSEVSGEEAVRWGMLARSVDAASVGTAAQELVMQLAAAPTVAVGLTKQLIHRSHGADLDRHLAEEATAIELSSRSADFAEYRKARAEKRPPTFEGR